MSVPFIFTERDGNEEIVVVVSGKHRSVLSTDPKYKALKNAIKTNASEAEVEEILFDNKVVVPVEPEIVMLHGIVNFDNGVASELVFNNGKLFLRTTEIDESLSNELTSLCVSDMPKDGMINFIYRLYDSVRSPGGKRVNARVRKELLAFIKRNSIVVDSAGDIISYKAVRPDYFDKHTGKTFKNAPGTRVWMDFGDVDDNANIGCSKGLHCGSLDYVASFGHGNDRIVIVRVDPADVVSVPLDCDCQKLRCCAYTVIGDYEGELRRKVYEATDDASSMYDEDYDYYGYNDEDDDEDDDDWDSVDNLDSWDEDEDEDDDDVYLQGEVHTEQVKPQCCNQPSNHIYGVKPTGHKFYNNRGPDGKFSSQ